MTDDRSTEGDNIARRFREADTAGDTAGMAAATTAMRAHVDRLEAAELERDLDKMRNFTAGTFGWWGDDPEAGWFEYGPVLDKPS